MTLLLVSSVGLTRFHDWNFFQIVLWFGKFIGLVYCVSLSIIIRAATNRNKNNILILIYFVLILSFVIFRSIRTIVFESDPESVPNCPLERHWRPCFFRKWAGENIYDFCQGLSESQGSPNLKNYKITTITMFFFSSLFLLLFFSFILRA